MIKLKRIVASLLLFAMFIALSMWPVCAVADSNTEAPAESTQLSADPEQPGEVTPSPEQPGEVMPSPEQPGEVTPSPEQTGDVTPSPEQPGEVTPSPEQTGEVTPSPEQTGEVTPSPEQTDTEGTDGTPEAKLPVSEKLTQQDNLAAMVYVSKDAYLKSVAGETPSEDDIQRDVAITLSGCIPEGAYVVAYPVGKEDLPDALDDINVLCAYDITIYTSNGVEFEPDVDNHIIVSISAPEQLEGVDKASVYHVEKETESEPAPEPELVAESVPVPAGEVEFNAKAFSIYVVTDETSHGESNPYIINIANCDPSGWAHVDLTRHQSSNKQAWSIQKRIDDDPDNPYYSDFDDETKAKLDDWDSDTGTVRFSVSNSTDRNTMYRVRYKTSSSWGHVHYEDFYVKVVKRTMVSTIDSTSLGVTLKMLDYNELSAFTGNLTGGGWNNGKIKQNLLNRTLDPASGYPTYSGNNTSISPDIGNIINNGASVNHLFLNSVYDDSGTFYYNSAENYAYLGPDGNFKVYKAVGTIDDASANKYQDQVGNFLPYNDLSYTNSGVPNTYGVGTYGRDGSNAYPDFINLPGNPDAATVAKDCGTLYKPSNPPVDFLFGLYMNAEFAQLKDGLYKGSPMVFNFSGDDDVWVYIDGVLVLDLGGIHVAQSGSINFATGDVRWTDDGGNGSSKTFSTESWETTIFEQFRLANAPLTGFKTKNGNTIFNDNTQHTITVFYFERGQGESDLMLSFNLPTIHQNTISVTKQVTGPGAGIAADKDYSFRLYTSTDGSTYNAETGNYTLVQKGTTAQTEDNGTFTLKNGETAQFKNIPDGTLYYVEELDPGDGCSVKFNDSSAEKRAGSYWSGSGTEGYYNVGTMAMVTCTNYYPPHTANLTIYKTNNAETPAPLENAVFALFNNTGTAENPVWTPAGNYTTDANGCAVISSLSEGRYKLEESTAPTGYTLLADPIYFSVSPTGVLTLAGTAPEGVSLNGPADGMYTLSVKNSPGYRLPETGGAGIGMFTQTGTLLIFAAFAGIASLFLLPKRRKRDGAKTIDRGGGGCRPDG